jgi:hypothetical protein
MLLGASAFDNAFDEGVTAYRDGDFSTAIQHFETLAEQGVAEPEVFFNLGNAYYRTGQLGAAIASYERALQLDPGSEPILENLNRAVARTEASLPRPNPPDWEQAFFFWHGDLTGRGSLAIAAAAWCLAWVLFAVRFFRPWPYLRMGGVLLIAISLLLLGSWRVKSHPQSLAVAARDRVPVRYGRRAEETVRFQLFEGDRVRVDDRREGWVRVETFDGERGWTEANNLYFVGPPYEPFTGSGGDTP